MEEYSMIRTSYFILCEAGVMAELSYTGAMDFKDGVDRTEEYTYDANGNMTSDRNKGIYIPLWAGDDNRLPFIYVLLP